MIHVPVCIWLKEMNGWVDRATPLDRTKVQFSFLFGLSPEYLFPPFLCGGIWADGVAVSLLRPNVAVI